MEKTDTVLPVTPLLITFVSAFLTVYVFLRIQQMRKHNRLNLPPAMPSLPIVGSLPFMMRGGMVHHQFAEKAKTLGPIFTCYFGSKLVLVLNDRQSINEALLKKSAIFSGRHRFYTGQKFFNRSAKGIIFRQYSEEFRSYRQNMLNILKEFGFGNNVMEERIRREVQELIDLIMIKKGQAFDPADNIAIATLNVVVRILFPQKLQQTDLILKELNENIHRIIHNRTFLINVCPPLRFLPNFRNRLQQAYQSWRNVNEFSANEIKTILETGNTETSYTTRIIENEGASDYDKEDLICVCRNLMEAGSDTSATTTTWTLTLLANNPDIQKRLQEQIDTRLGTDILPSAIDMAKVPYVEATILEVLRLTSVLPLSLPHQALEETYLAGYYIPKGTMVIPNLYAVHMNKDVWGDPEVFRPERFLDESGEQVVGRNGIIPFSIGRRSCLGEQIARQQLFILLTGLLQNFEIRPPEGQSRVDPKPTLATIIAPEPFQVRMIPRKKQTETNA